MKYDITILGAGLSGLSSAYFLARHGLKVCLLEKNAVTGGCMQGFKRKKIEFDTGAHYIGGLEKGQSLYKYFKYMGIFEDVVFQKMDENAFDIIKFPEKEYKIAYGLQNFKDRLTEYFPEEKNAIETFADKLKYIAESLPLYNLEKNYTQHRLSDFDINAYDYLKSLTSNEELLRVLFGSNLLYLAEKEHISLYVYALINYGYIESAWRPVGGSSNITDSLLKSINKLGVDVFTNSEISEINFADNDNVYAQTFDGTIFHSQKLIATAHPQHVLKLVKSKLLRKSYIDRISELKNTQSFFSLYIQFKENSFEYLNSNYYCFANENIWINNQYDKNTFADGFLLITPAETLNQKYSNLAIVLCSMNYNDVKQWQNTSVEQRGNNYKEFKDEKTAKILEKIEKYFPGINSKIIATYSATPVTYENYTNSEEGSAYGINKISGQAIQTNISYLTKIRNLYLSGQSISTYGVHGVVAGAALLCNNILGDNMLVKSFEKFDG